jgi:hypothetical protein
MKNIKHGMKVILGVILFSFLAISNSFSAPSLKITSAPSGAKIYLNGEDQRRVTPATLKNLEEGRKYKIQLERTGYKNYETHLKVEKGTNHIHANLTQEKQEKPHKTEAKTKADESSGTAVERTFGYKKMYREGTYGWLEVHTTPNGAVVFINNKRQVGLTPNKYKLPVGTVKVSVVIRGKAVRNFSEVTIRSGQTTALEPIDFRDEITRPNTKNLLK